MSNKPSVPRGMRDFLPTEMARRNRIFGTIRNAFEKYGYACIETPAMEKLETLTGKYGEEGDRLIFKVLNSGDYLKKADDNALQNRNSSGLTSSISEKALRYDLTVPFARYVVQHQNDLTFPFKRYQIQPVWRADRPQKGRYREFYQCDADVVGTDSLWPEVELIQLFDEVLTELGLPSFSIRINNRKVLLGMAQLIGCEDRFVEMTTAIDKLDKIGYDGVANELRDRDFSFDQISKLNKFLTIANHQTNSDNNYYILQKIENSLVGSEIGIEGVQELKFIENHSSLLKFRKGRLDIDLTLARGLDYYTGAIFEVIADDVEIGSIGGGGRYDDLTGIFGMKGLSGVGISFGADRIYDVMNHLGLFEDEKQSTVQVLFANFGEKEASWCAKAVKELRDAGIKADLYPDAAKLGKQFKYADSIGVDFMAVVGEKEMEQGNINLKEMATGEQESIKLNSLIEKLSV